MKYRRLLLVMTLTASVCAAKKPPPSVTGKPARC